MPLAGAADTKMPTSTSTSMAVSVQRLFSPNNKSFDLTGKPSYLSDNREKHPSMSANAQQISNETKQ
ncbi:hypothetical protein Y032_0003g1426 [Ancylostoma ceylanicum]|uniref:Uncharacterized protein n=1 Tax=Ancylostoma ceylanicum TaxID=53326 RepID=A0A016VXL2_9BILA|nr:hypothetical protein Y032_0003g1426 [Ancylostoma ceylanicum]